MSRYTQELSEKEARTRVNRDMSSGNKDVSLYEYDIEYRRAWDREERAQKATRNVKYSSEHFPFFCLGKKLVINYTHGSCILDNPIVTSFEQHMPAAEVEYMPTFNGMIPLKKSMEPMRVAVELVAKDSKFSGSHVGVSEVLQDIETKELLKVMYKQIQRGR
jgi:hypothetical protein